MTTVRENIVAQLKSMLSGISVANGYNNDIATVERWQQRGNSLNNTPLIVIVPGEEIKTPDPNPFYTCHLPIALDVWICHDEADLSQSTDQIINSILGDIERCIMTDPSLAGYALDAIFKSNTQFQGAPGQPYAGIVIILEVLYQHRLMDSTLAV